MSNGTVDDLRKRVGIVEEKLATLEKGVLGICQRLFRLERKVLAAATLLILGDSGDHGEGRLEIESLNAVISSLTADLPEFKVRLEELKHDFGDCCPLLEDDEPDDRRK